MNVSKIYIDVFKATDKKTKTFYEYADPIDFDIKKDALFIKAVNLAYLDAARTFKGIKDKGEVLEELAIEIKNYFKSNDTNFENAHKDFCNKFIDGLKEKKYYATYGQAQKVVNMAFKYLYCCKGAEKYEDKFTNCHMALDSYTLNWFKYDVLRDWYNNELEREGKTKIKIGLINDQYTWSNLESGDIEKEYSYHWFQNIIRKYLNDKELSHYYKTEDGNVLTSFEAEFYIWPEQQWKEASKKLLSLKESMIALASQSELENFDEIFNMINEIHSKLKF